jgi:hypothetical protein
MQNRAVGGIFSSQFFPLAIFLLTFPVLFIKFLVRHIPLRSSLQYPHKSFIFFIIIHPDSKWCKI